MKHTTFIAAAVLAGCATVPANPPDLQVTITAARVAECRAQGGCNLLTQDEILQLVAEAIEAGNAQARQTLDSHGCKRGML